MQVEEHANSYRKKKIHDNQVLLRAVIRALRFCASQGIALRGRREDLTQDDGSNKGNFLALAELLSEYDQDLRRILQDMKEGKTKMVLLSPTIQNEVLGIMANKIRSEMTKEVNDSEVFTLIADEATAHNKKFLSICIRYFSVLQVKVGN